MRKLAILIAVGAAALMGGSTANAADAVKAQSPADVKSSTGMTDFSAQRRHHHHGHRHHHMRHHHHWGHHHRPYYRSYNYYAPRAYGYHGPRYYGGGPGVTFSFGSGGYRGW